MTARSYVTIWCDGMDGDGVCVSFVETGERTAAEARKTAKREGFIRRGSMDLCPAHHPRSR